MSEGARTTTIVRQHNIDTVLYWLRADSSLTVRELQSRTGLSRPTLDAVVDDVIGIGLATASVDRTAAGRPARRIHYAPSAGAVAGVDIGRVMVRVMITDLVGEPLAETVTEWNHPQINRGDRMAATVAAVADCAEQAALTVTELKAIAVGTPGTVDPDSGAIEMCEVIPQWADFDLGSRLAAELGVPRTLVCVENDANLAAIAERWRGRASGTDHAVVLMVGERPGAGIIANGELLRGHHGWAGELFLWDLWGQHYAHAPMPVRGAADAIEKMSATLRGQDQGDAEQPLTELQIFVNGAAWTIAAVASLLGPERIILNGLPETIEAPLLAAWRRALSEMVPQIPTELCASRLGDRLVALGAIHRALESAQEQYGVRLL